MAIEVEKLHSFTARSFGSSGRDFDDMLISAVNDVSRDLRRDTYETVATSGSDGENVERITDAIDLGKKYIKVYKDGIRYYMSIASEWGREPDGNEEAIYRRSMADAQYISRTDKDPDVGFVR